jgi:uncharacterized C2H2 Zn-finger protein
MKCTYHECNKKLPNGSNEILKHIFTHSHDANFFIRCPLCDNRPFKLFSALEKHFNKNHSNNLVSFNNSKQIYKCNHDSCHGVEFNQLKDLFSHLQSHFELNIIKNLDFYQMCIYKNCNATLTSFSSFKTHHSKHCKIDKNYANIKDIYAKYLQANLQSNVQMGNDNGLMDEMDDSNEEMNENSLTDLNIEENEENEETIMSDIYMRMHLKFSSKYLIQSYALEEIFLDFKELLKINNADLIKKCKKVSTNGSIDVDTLEELAIQTSLYEKVYNKNKNKSAQLDWKISTGCYVPGIEIKLDDDDKFYYIPIIDNLKAMFNNKEIFKEYFKTKTSKQNEICSFNDGLAYRNNPIFSSYENSLQLKLFIDAYTTTNALHDAHKDYKYHGLYLKLNNLDNSLLSKDYVTQLVLLFNDKLVKKYPFTRLLDCMINDLIILETTGILIEKINLKGSICYMSADSLGANQIMGLVQNFGSRTDGK